jgi:heterotetrameric sarcosine oxidase gamma subunit
MAELTRTSPLQAYWHAGRPAVLAAEDVVVTERPFLAKRLLRGAAEYWREILRRKLALELPDTNAVRTREGVHCLWLRPDEWLLIGGPAAQAAPFDRLVPLAEGSAATNALFDVSDRFQCLEVRGAAAAELLNCGCSVEFSEYAFAAGHCCRSRIEEVPVIISKPHGSLGFDVMPERALTDYLWRWMSAALREFSAHSILN